MTGTTDHITAPIQFSKIPLYVQDEIVKKMSFEGFAAFAQTGTMAQSLCLRNKGFLYPMNVDNIIIAGDMVYMKYEDREVNLTFEMCENMKFPEEIEVNVMDMWFSEEVCDFLLKIGNIKTLKCPFLEVEKPQMIEFFKKARIQHLQMTTVFNGNYIEVFPYDTSNIDQVEVDDCRPLTHDALYAIKARHHIILTSVWTQADHLIQYIESLRDKTEKMVNLSIYRYLIFYFQEFIRFLNEEGTFVKNGTWTLTRANEERPFMKIENADFLIKFREC